MSGLEVAGLVLGALPLVIKALDAYISLMRGWGKAPLELQGLHRQLATENSKLYNVCDQLLADAMPIRDIEPMLQEPFGPLWEAKETNDRIRRRVWNSYEPFEKNIKEVKNALQELSQRLSVHIERDGEVTYLPFRLLCQCP
jgi:hypothetical protein